MTSLKITSLLDLITVTPQGDGNVDRIPERVFYSVGFNYRYPARGRKQVKTRFITSRAFRFNYRYPARGRKLIIRQVKFEILYDLITVTPQGDGNVATSVLFIAVVCLI